MIARKAGELIRKGNTKFETWREYSNSRKQAISLHNKVKEFKGSSILTKTLNKRIKDYSESMFGSQSYWPWLALYTEIRDEFIEGWIPDDFYRLELIPYLNPISLSKISTLKSYDHRLFPDFALEPYAIIINGLLFNSNHERIDFSDFRNLLEKIKGEVVVKWDSARTGEGVLIKNSNEIKESDFKNGYNYVIQPFVKQHNEIARLYDKSVNTMRIVTVINNDNTVKVLLTILRVGMGGVRVDKLESGGGFMSVGEEGNVNSKAYNSHCLPIGDKHPDSGVNFESVIIPSFKKAISKCISSHDLFPYMKFIAWDVSINESAEPILIEWNSVSPGMWRYEATFGPLWKDTSIYHSMNTQALR